MKRFSAHYIYLSPGVLQKAHYIELSDDDVFVACNPLEQEIEAVSFYNGILFLVEKSKSPSPQHLLADLQQIQLCHPGESAFKVLELSPYIKFNPATPVAVFHLDGLNLSSPEFSANDGRGQGYIQRL